MIKQNLTVHNSKTQRVAKDLLRNQNDIKHTKDSLVAVEKDIILYNEQLEALKSKAIDRFLVNKNVAPDFLKKVRRLRNDDKLHIRNILNNKDGDKKYYLKTIPIIENTVNKLTAKMEALLIDYPSKLVNINDVMISLSEFPAIDLESTRLELTNGIPYLYVFLTGIECTASSNHYANIKDNSWILPDLQLRINLQDGMSRVIKRDPKVLVPKAWTDNVPHPHIMSGDGPCYGDFLGAVVEAYEDLDISHMVTIMLLFLEQAYPEDDAGAFWPRFALFQAQGFKYAIHKATIQSCAFQDVGYSGVPPFYGYAKTTPDGAKWFIPVLEGGTMEMHKLPYQKESALRDFFEDLKLPYAERKMNMKTPPPVKKRGPAKKRAAKKPKAVTSDPFDIGLLPPTGDVITDIPHIEEYRVEPVQWVHPA